MGSLRPRTIIEYLQMLWRRKLLIILFSTAVMLAAYNAMSPVRNVYESSALVAISVQSSDEKSAIDVQLAAVNQYMQSRANLEPIIKRYKLYGDKTDMETAIGMLRRDLNIVTKLREYYPQFPTSFTITYKNNDPALAMQVTNDLVSYFSDTNEMLEKRSANEISNLDSDINEVEGRLKQISQQRTSGALSARSLSVLRSQKALLMSAIETLSDKELSLNKRIADQQRQISEQEKLVKATPLSSNDSARGSSAYGVLLSQKVMLEAQLKEQKSQYTDKNSKVIQTQAQIAEFNRQLAQLENTNTGGQADLSAAYPEIRELRDFRRQLVILDTELELTKRELERKRQALALLPSDINVSPAEIASGGTSSNLLPNDNTKEADGADEYSLLFNRYGSLMEKRDSLRRSGAARTDAKSGLFQVVDKAAMPTSPVSPNRLKLMLVACAMAVFVGLMAAFVVEAPRLMMIQDERDVEYLLGAPVIGLIPETLTPSESRHNRKLILVRALGVLLLAAMLVPVLAILLKKFQVFQIIAK